MQLYCSSFLINIPEPCVLSSELVPRKISSISTRVGDLLFSRCLMILCSLFSSAMKYEVCSCSESLTRMEVRTFIGVNSNRLAQTGAPHCASSKLTPNVRRKVVLPLIFEPVTSASLSSLPIVKSFATRSCSGIRGCASCSAAMPALLSLTVGY